MEYRKKEYVRQSGFIFYLIQYKWFIFWFNYKSFSSRQSRDIYLHELSKKNK